MRRRQDAAAKIVAKIVPATKYGQNTEAACPVSLDLVAGTFFTRLVKEDLREGCDGRRSVGEHAAQSLA